MSETATGGVGAADDRPGSGAPRVALVTGAGRGLGAAIATRLHAIGLRVALLDRDGDAVAEVARGLDPGLGSALALTVDVDDTAAVEAALGEVAGRWHAPDILVNNAARTVPGSVWDIALDEWDAVMTTNLRSVLVLTRLCAAPMRERGWGRVINLSSLAGQQGGTLAGAHYSAAKAGVLALTKVFARELAPYGVTVNVDAGYVTGATFDINGGTHMR
ncbi:SDR family oxidoreductase [Kitasatospora sp. NPDC059146]|uniref:SDR family oxidoreductase n=1 Tax=unclassified Kitasatospora TaxID=2633591 RepID=UPI0036D11977